MVLDIVASVSFLVWSFVAKSYTPVVIQTAVSCRTWARGTSLTTCLFASQRFSLFVNPFVGSQTEPETGRPDLNAHLRSADQFSLNLLFIRTRRTFGYLRPCILTIVTITTIVTKLRHQKTSSDNQQVISSRPDTPGISQTDLDNW